MVIKAKAKMIVSTGDKFVTDSDVYSYQQLLANKDNVTIGGKHILHILQYTEANGVVKTIIVLDNNHPIIPVVNILGDIHLSNEEKKESMKHFKRIYDGTEIYDIIIALGY